MYSGDLKAPEKVITREELGFSAEAESRVPYEFTVTDPMPSFLREVTAMSHKPQETSIR